MDTTLTDLQRQGHLRVSPECFARLQVISPATLDRLRAAARSRVPPGRGHTRPGTLLKRQIPIRTFADWDDARPGFVEVDLVDHSGGQASGEFAQTLTATELHRLDRDAINVGGWPRATRAARPPGPALPRKPRPPARHNPSDAERGVDRQHRNAAACRVIEPKL